MREGYVVVCVACRMTFHVEFKKSQVLQLKKYRKLSCVSANNNFNASTLIPILRNGLGGQDGQTQIDVAPHNSSL